MKKCNTNDKLAILYYLILLSIIISKDNFDI
jgi:hypothetical protein